MADDKVVIGSNEGRPVKPGDLTKVTSIISVASTEDDAVATSTIPRMKIKANVDSAATDAPVASVTPAVTHSTESLAEEVAGATSKIPRTRMIKSAGSPEDDAVATSAIPTMKVSSPNESVVEDAAVATSKIPRTKISAASTAEDDSTATSTIPRMKLKTGATGDSAVAPTGDEEDKVRKMTTVKLKPAVVGETAGAVAVPAQVSGASRGPAPSPSPAQATASPRVVSEDETVRIQKPRSALSSSTAVPGVKQTIKLRPSSTTPAPDSSSDSSAGISAPPPQPSSPAIPQASVSTAGASEAKRTIRLVPKKSDATSGGDQLSAAKPSAPTVRIGGAPSPSEAGAESAVDSPQKRTLKLKSTRPPEATTITPRPVPVVTSPFPSAPTPTPVPTPVPPMPIPPAVAAATDPELTSSLGGEGTGISPVVVEEKVQPVVYSPSERQEPSIVFTIAACIAFCVMGYFAWMLVGQYCNSHMDKNIPVPGLSGKVK